MPHFDRLWLTLCVVMCPAAAAAADIAEIRAAAQRVQKSPDISISGTFDLPSPPAILDQMLRSPLLLARIYEDYDFPPRYKARPQGDAIHVDDPNGIAGEIYLIEQSPGRRAYYGTGALNHKLVPAFRGTMTLVLSTSPKDKGTSARVDVHFRTESRIVGFVASTFFPLFRARVQNRMAVNARDIGIILKDVMAAPAKVAEKLAEPDAEALRRLFPQRAAQ